MISPQEQEFRAKLKELRDHLTKNADNVGTKFPEEARKMHYGETEHRSIYGVASPEEAKSWPRKASNFIRCRACRTSGINTPTTNRATPITTSTMPIPSRCVVGLFEDEPRHALCEQYFDQCQRAHVGGGGDGESKEPEFRRERTHETGEQRRLPGPGDSAQNAGVAQARIGR